MNPANAPDGPGQPKPWWKRWGMIATGVGTLAGILSAPVALNEFLKLTRASAARIGTVDLPTSYPNESWTPLRAADFSWLEDEWCYPTLPGFVTRFRVVDGKLQRQNQGQQPSPFVTEWVDVDAYKSSNGMMRLWHSNEWPGSYVHYTENKTAEWRENERYQYDDGSVGSTDKMLVLSCTRCTLTNDGLTYECED